MHKSAKGVGRSSLNSQISTIIRAFMQTSIHVGCCARLSQNVGFCNFRSRCCPLPRKVGAEHRGDSEVARLNRLRINVGRARTTKSSHVRPSVWNDANANSSRSNNARIGYRWWDFPRLSAGLHDKPAVDELVRCISDHLFVTNIWIGSAFRRPMAKSWRYLGR
jgi:hypothetical protein